MRIIRTCSALLVMGVLFAPCTIAQNQPDNDLSNLNLEQLMKVQFYTASKHAEDVSATPASVTVITRADIRTYGYRTLADVLQSVRGYWVNSDRNYSYLGVRGFARPGDYNTRILLLVNGHPLNDNIYYQALIGTEFPLDVDLIERIEIVRGASSSLYGTNAFFGVINVVTQQPPISPTVETSVEAGSELYRKARVTVGLPGLLNGALFSASMYRADGAPDIYFPEFDQPENNHGIAHRVDGDRNESAFALLRWKHWTLEGLIGSREKQIPTASFDTIFNDPWNRTVDSRGFGELTYQRDFVSGLQLTSRWFYDGYSYHGTYAYLQDGSRMLNHDTARGDSVGTELNVSRPFGHRNTITGGLDFRYNLRKEQRNRWESSPVFVLDDHRSGSVIAFYVQDELKVTSQLSVNAGLRLDHYDTFGSALSPRLAAIFRPDNKTTLKYIFGHAFRVPNAYELYYSDAVSQEPNPRLQPETIDSHNIAVERALTPNIRAIGEVFYSRLGSLLDTRIDPATGMSQFVNVQPMTGKGLEFELEAQRGGWRGQLSYTLQVSHDSQSQVLANVPRHVAKLRFQVPLSSALLAGPELQYKSPQSTYLNVRVPDSLNANLTVSTRKPLLGFDLSASCYNLLDRRNYDPGAPGLQQSRLLQDGRGIRFKITRTISRH